MEQHHQRFSLSDKEHSVINYISSILKDTLVVQQEMLSQLNLLNNRVLTLEHQISQSLQEMRSKQKN
jgi:hypothetical protein